MTLRQSRMLADRGIDERVSAPGKPRARSNSRGGYRAANPFQKGLFLLKSALQAPAENPRDPNSPRGNLPRQPEESRGSPDSFLCYFNPSDRVVPGRGASYGHFVGDPFIAQKWRGVDKSGEKPPLASSMATPPIIRGAGAPYWPLWISSKNRDQPRLFLFCSRLPGQLTTWGLPEESYLSIPDPPELMADAEAKGFWHFICDRE
ncbi:MAG: hypothetical protein CM15mP120_27920 [Pseudomonadota bacterium]|nr:MAG: hypothetical protein CM15mP120_27920 [Pseudomonadota bacterium]